MSTLRIRILWTTYGIVSALLIFLINHGNMENGTLFWVGFIILVAGAVPIVSQQPYYNRPYTYLIVLVPIAAVNLWLEMKGYPKVNESHIYLSWVPFIPCLSNMMMEITGNNSRS